jgi:hypothetical protein
MAQTQTQKYASNIQSAEQKFAHSAYFLKMKISKTIAVFKQKVAKLTSGSPSRSPYLADTITIQEMKDQVRIKYDSTAEFRRCLPLM